jgi:centromere protein C
VKVVVCDTSFVLATGGMFIVPRGNMYSIKNIADRDSKLFFTQARKIRENEKEESEPAASRGVSVAMGARSENAVSMGAGTTPSSML